MWKKMVVLRWDKYRCWNLDVISTHHLIQAPARSWRGRWTRTTPQPVLAPHNNHPFILVLSCAKESGLFLKPLPVQMPNNHEHITTKNSRSLELNQVCMKRYFFYPFCTPASLPFPSLFSYFFALVHNMKNTLVCWPCLGSSLMLRLLKFL